MIELFDSNTKRQRRYRKFILSCGLGVLFLGAWRLGAMWLDLSSPWPSGSWEAVEATGLKRAVIESCGSSLNRIDDDAGDTTDAALSEAADIFGVHRELLIAVMFVESRCQTHARSAH